MATWSTRAFLLYYIWLFRKRHIFTTLIQIVGPILVILIFSTGSTRHYAKLDTSSAATLSEDQLIDSIKETDCPAGQNQYVTYYAPGGSTAFAEKMISRMKTLYANATNGIVFQKVEREAEILKFAVIHHAIGAKSCYIGGIVFQNDPFKSGPSGDEIELKVKLRMAQNVHDEMGSVTKRSIYFDPQRSTRDYEPFLGFQIALSKAFLSLYADIDTSNSNITQERCYNLNLSAQPFPITGVYTHELELEEGGHPTHVIASVALVLGQTFMVISLVRGPALDKQTGFRTYLRLVGISRGTYWSMWWWNDFFIRVPVAAAQTAMLFSDLSPQIPRLIQRGNYYIWFGFLVVYNMASISFFIFMASFNKRGLTATYLAATIWLLSYYVGDLFVISKYYTILRPGTFLMCLNPNSALALACKLMTTRADGAQFYSLLQRAEQHEISLLEVCLMLLVDALLYFILALYGDLFRPERYGAKCWQHCRTSFRVHGADCMDRTKICTEQLLYGENTDSVSSEIMPCYDIVFAGVSLAFERRVKVLEDVSLQILDKKRTAIVGPGGAGKTTLARLICGVFPPTDGTVRVAGYDAVIQNSRTRGILSICPEQNLLCDYMTLFEHLKLIGRLRGYRVSRASRKARKMLEALELTEYSNEFPGNLVGIQKRKLCIALALIGNPKIVVFDNPTDGMDLETTIQMLQFISAYCEGKTSLLLTPNLSEAYYFAERIAILSNSRILGSGTKEQLESCLKTGYHLQLKLSPSADAEAVKDFVADHISSVQKLEKQSQRIQSALELVENQFYEAFMNQDSKSSLTQSEKEAAYVDRASRSRSRAVSLADLHIPDFDEEDLGTTSSLPTLTLVLPRTEAHKFSKLFELLESDLIRRERGIISYKLLPYTIEVAYDEVENYMRLNDVKDDIEKGDNKVNVEELLSKHHAERLRWKTCQRLKALVVKRVAYLFSVWFHTLMQFIVPVLLMAAVVNATSRSFGTKLEGDVVPDSLNRFPKPVALVRQVITTDPATQNLYVYYKNLVGSGRVLEVKSFKAQIAKVQRSTEDELASRYVVGAELDTGRVVAAFSPLAFHAGPTSMSLILNSYLKCIRTLLSANFQGHAILSRTEEILKFYLEPKPSADSRPAMTFALVIGFGFFVYTSRFICQPLAERTILLKNLQLNTGLSAFTYWFAYLICDVFYTGILTSVAYFNATFLVQLDDSINTESVKLWAWMLFVIGALSSILHSYAFSFIFTQPNTSFFAMLSYNEVAGLFLFVLTTFMEGTGGDVLVFISRIISQPFNIVSTMFNYLDITFHNARCKTINDIVRESICDTDWTTFKITVKDGQLDKSCCDYFKTGKWKYMRPYFSTGLDISRQRESVTVDVMFLILHGIIAIVFISYMEGGWRCKYSRRRSRGLEPIYIEDIKGGVEDEESVFVTIAKKPKLEFRNHRHLYVQGISKRFFFGSEVLTGVSFSAAPGDLIAIVGPSHSGKSILMRILTGNLRATRGLIQFKTPGGSKRVNFLKYMGFTPSDEVVNAFPNMKGITLLKVFARLRGIPDSQLKAHVNKWTTLLGLQRRLNQECEHYTTAVRSKLALALALVGDPPILVLDEPFEGLDPFFKNQFWTIMDYLRRETGRIIILATANMQEVQMGSTKVIILVNGTIQCSMSPEQLMQRYGGGLLITFKLREGTTFKNLSSLKSRVRSDFPGISLENESINMLEYRLRPKSKEQASQAQLAGDAEKKDVVKATSNAGGGEESKTEKPLRWSYIFLMCQSIYQDNASVVTEYSVSEETSQDVYNRFASKQLPYKQPVGSREEFCTTYC